MFGPRRDSRRSMIGGEENSSRSTGLRDARLEILTTLPEDERSHGSRPSRKRSSMTFRSQWRRSSGKLLPTRRYPACRKNHTCCGLSEPGMGFEGILAITADLVDQGGISARPLEASWRSHVENIVHRGCDARQQASPAVMDQGMTLPAGAQRSEPNIAQEPLSVHDVEAAVAQLQGAFSRR
jgi:hypothetical protein